MKQIRESWVNVYERENGECEVGQVQDNKQQCISNIIEYVGRKYICTIPLHELKKDEA